MTKPPPTPQSHRLSSPYCVYGFGDIEIAIGVVVIVWNDDVFLFQSKVGGPIVAW
ncbi:hypothetical protein BDW42DRAFT_166935 [Aspergillus taichungensis]|uniref:Uncharacterized protein n=1 Tax=Aspergillus taichungensis TaxID=482145 RepID=A0A2J5HXS4_9EURO|nr:hypothetical protein BDW42DRAFT_166935 [Aspergillus taichungensis]